MKLQREGEWKRGATYYWFLLLWWLFPCIHQTGLTNPIRDGESNIRKVRSNPCISVFPLSSVLFPNLQTEDSVSSQAPPPFVIWGDSHGRAIAPRVMDGSESYYTCKECKAPSLQRLKRTVPPPTPTTNANILIPDIILSSEMQSILCSLAVLDMPAAFEGIDSRGC